MKKIILSAIALCAFTFANAQDIKSSKGENYLPEAGDWAIGFNADGLFNYVGNAFNKDKNAAPSVDFQKSGTFVGKKFTSATEAYRVVVNFAFASNESLDAPKNVSGDLIVPTGTFTNTPQTYKTSGFDLYAGLGKEWRKGKTRLQGFYGADAYLRYTSYKYTATAPEGGKDQTYEPGSKIGLGVNGFIGAEYFLFPKISIGAQYTYGLNISSNSAPKFDNGTTSSEGKKSSEFSLGGVNVASINMTLHF